MTLSSNEVFSGGNVRDQDERWVVAQATGGGKALQFVAINTATSGSQSLVAAPTAGAIKVVSYAVVASGAVSVQFLSGATALTGAMALAANGGISCPGSPDAHLFQCAATTVLNISLGAAVQVSGHLAYFIE